MNLMQTQRHVLVTGASGFLGEHVARHLAVNGGRVAGTFFSHAIEIPYADLAPVDLRDEKAVHRLIRDMQPAAVIHCAATTSPAFCQQEPESAKAAILDATRFLVEAIQEKQPETPFLAVSTDLVFDGEHAPYGAGAEAKPVSVYGSLKLQAEALVAELPRGVVIRPALIYGPPGTHSRSFLGWMRENLAAGKPLGLFEDEVRTPVYVDDLADAMVAILEHGETGIWHAGGPGPLNRMQMGELVCRVFEYDRSLLRPQRLADSDYAAPRPRNVSLDSSQLWETLDRSPRSFESGLRRIAVLEEHESST
ncbi:SDR family oxidoreductase [bacterium]|nr:SDR family oxidoreductase [bacterium]